MGEAPEDDTEGGGGTSHLGKVLLRSNTGSAVVWGGGVVVVGANGAEARGSSCGITETGEQVEGKKAEGQLVVEGGG